MSYKIPSIGFIFFFLFNLCQAQNFVNGSFEGGIQDCMIDISNDAFSTFMPGVEGLGELGQLDILTFGCEKGTPREGENFIALQSKSGITDAIAIEISEPITFGIKYYIEFWARISSETKGSYRLALGMNSTSNANGELLFTISNLSEQWQRVSVPFTGSIQASYITCLIESGDDIEVFFDGFKFGCPTISLGRDTTYCEFEPRLLEIPDIYEGYEWSTGSDEHEINVLTPGTYSVTASYSNCQVIDEITLLERAELCDCKWYIPNIFSPNGDGINDEWSVSTLCMYSDFEVEVYDVWGNLVFRSIDIYESWRGYSGNGNLMNSGVYTYQMKYIESDGSDKVVFGTVTLLR